LSNAAKVSDQCDCCAEGAEAFNDRSGDRHGFSKFIKRWTHIIKRVAALIELVRNIQKIIENGKS
jgi:hypothetical protein